MLSNFKLIEFSSIMLLILGSLSFAGVKNEEVIYKKLILKASKEQIWSTLTDQNELGKWWNKGVRLEPYVGGQFYEPWGEGQLATGKVVDLKFQKFIKFTWKEKYWNSSESTVCTFFLEKVEKGTVLKIHHSGWESIKELSKRKKLIEGFQKGWDLLLPKLKKYVESEKP